MLSSLYIQFFIFQIMSATLILAHTVVYIFKHIVWIVNHLDMNLDQLIDTIMGNHFLKQNFE